MTNNIDPDKTPGHLLILYHKVQILIAQAKVFKEFEIWKINQQKNYGNIVLFMQNTVNIIHKQFSFSC